MDLEKIEGLVKILENSSLTEMSLKEGDFKISLSKLEHPALPTGPMHPFPPMGMPAMAGAAFEAAKAQAQPEEEEEDDSLIVSPIVGVFYAAPAPDAPPFVKVGDHLKKGQTVCILEAMKLMNEIPCEFDCEIEAVLVSNEQKVEYGQPLFRVKKV